MFRRKQQKSTKDEITAIYHHLIDHVIPNRRNDHRPHALRHRVLAGYSAVLVSLKVLVVTTAIVLPSVTAYSSSISRANIIYLTNQTRIGLGLPTLFENGLLNNAAQAKAVDMLSDAYFAHTSPDGLTPWNFINNAGYYYQYAGENLAVHYSSSEGVLAGWMASPTHRANIVDERYSEIGVGVSEGIYEDYNTTFVVQMFGHRPGSTNTPATEEVIEGEDTDTVLTPTEPEPPVAPEPEPVPTETTPEAPVEPVEVAIVPEPVNEDPVVTSAAILPVEGGFEFNVETQNSETVTAQIGESTLALEPGTELGSWTGVLPAHTEEGQEVSLMLTSVKGDTSTEPIAWIGSEDPASIFAFGQNSEPYKLLGIFTLQNVDDSVNNIYVAVMIALALLLAVSILVKVEIQRHDHLAHGLFVILGAAVLILI